MPNLTPTDPGTLAGATEIAEITDRSRQRVHQFIREEGFPDPVDVLADGRTPIWRRLDIEQWWATYQATHRQTGAGEE